MPVKRCQKDNKPGYKWGDKGKCYTYKKGNKKEEEIAKEKAKRQGRAIKASGYREGKVISGDLNTISEKIEKLINKENE